MYDDFREKLLLRLVSASLGREHFIDFMRRKLLELLPRASNLVQDFKTAPVARDCFDEAPTVGASKRLRTASCSI